MAKKQVDIPLSTTKPDPNTMKELLDYKNSLENINQLIVVLDGGTYPLSLLQKMPKVVQYVENLRRGTDVQIQSLEKKLQDQQGL